MSRQTDTGRAAGRPWGLVAEFETSGQLKDAAFRAHCAGYRRMDGYSPFPIEGLPAMLGLRPTRLPYLVLAGGILGGAGAYFMMWYSSVVDYPIVSGGKPYHSWPSFIPITFELTVLGAALAAVVSMILLNGLPRPHHPVFGARGFERASQDRFFLAILADDPAYDSAATRAFLESLGAASIDEAADDDP
jgi:hypothetical protein